MALLSRVLWTLRAMVMAPFFGRLRMPSYVGPPTFLLGTRRIYIARRVRIFPGLRAETHQGGRIHFHEDIAIGQDFHITAMGELHIGSGTVVSAGVVVTDIDHEYINPDKPVLSQPLIYSLTSIGRNCFIGAGAKIQAGTVLGDGCIVGANSVVRGEYAPHSVIVGAPARVVKKYSYVEGCWERTG